MDTYETPRPMERSFWLHAPFEAEFLKFDRHKRHGHRNPVWLYDPMCFLVLTVYKRPTIVLTASELISPLKLRKVFSTHWQDVPTMPRGEEAWRQVVNRWLQGSEIKPMPWPGGRRSEKRMLADTWAMVPARGVAWPQPQHGIEHAHAHVDNIY